MGLQPFRVATVLRMALVALAAVWLAACQESDFPKAEKPVSPELTRAMTRLDMDPASPIFIRIYKESSEFEVWKQKRSGDYALLTTFPICKWSGALGPKKTEGDRQAPEGVYTVYASQMNPASHYYLSFNIGYPNAYDRSLGRTGSNLMVHGACSSAGCYSMTDESAGEIFALARDSFRGGQTAFEIQALPFRMTAQNFARHRDDPNMPFWRMLKVGADSFDLTLRPPKVDVCDRKYVFNADAPAGTNFDPTGKCPEYTVAPALAAALANKQAADDLAIQAASASLEDAERQAAAHAAEVAAKQQAEAAEQAAAQQQAATQPSLWDRMFGHRKAAEAAAASPVASAAPAVAPAQTGAKVAARVPAPRLRPDAKVTAPAPQSTSATSVGTVVKKKFLWPGDDGGTSSTSTSTGQSL